MAYPAIRNAADIEAYEQVPLAERLRHGNIVDWLVETADAQPDAPALRWAPPGDPTGELSTLTYGDFLARVRQTANLLSSLGMGPGDTVSFMLPMLPEAYLLLFAGPAAGIVNAINPLLEVSQIAEILDAAGTRVLVVDGPESGSGFWEKALAAREHVPSLETILVVGGAADPENDILSFREAIAEQPADRFTAGRRIDTDDVAAYYHTGGTTGTPKLARHTHRMQTAAICSTGAMIGYRPDDVMLVGLPLFHIGGSIIGGVVPLSLGSCVVVGSPAGFRDPGFVRDFWHVLHNCKATITGGVPTVLGALLNIPPGNADISSLRLCVTGGSTCPEEIGKAFAKMIGGPVLEGYGMTEVTTYSTLPPRDGRLMIGAVGLRVPYMELITAELDEAGEVVRECGPDEIGAVLMRGPMVMTGYVQARHNEGAFTADGWLNSGDLGRIDAEGVLTLVGRIKDLIIRGGHNIDPGMIEEVLHQHPAVEIAAAVGKPDSYAGELPVAYVQLRPGQQADAGELQAFARERIPERAANPVNIFLTEAMPLTGVGKVFKPELRWDSARRVFAEVLAPLAETHGVKIAVAVGKDEVHGTLARIAVSGPADAEAAARDAVTAALGPFPLRHRIDWTSA